MTNDFQDCLLASGIVCKEPIVFDGQLHRFANNGKGDKDGWYVARENGGAFGEWSLNINERWSPNINGLSADEKRKLNEQIARARIKYEKEKEMRQEETAKEAAHWWSKLSTTGASMYLERKQVKAWGVRFGSNSIVIPLCDIDGKLWTLQIIYHNGDKIFLKGGRKKGCFYAIGILEDSEIILICEGFATGATLYEATQIPTVVAFDAGNLESVTTALRTTWPEKQIVICADNDQWGQNNVGKETAEVVAAKHNCKVVLPFFTIDTIGEEKPTDFNDLHCLEGVEIVKEQLLRITQFLITDDATFIRLASLSPAEYDRMRDKEAKQLRIKKSTLDQEVKKKRREQSDEFNEESPSIFLPVEPWSEPVSVREILNELVVIFNRFAVLPAHADTALALWVLFTWCIDQMNVAPILAICSPEKQCGKTTVLSLVGQLVLRATPASNITPAALFRTIEAMKPTLIIDEADTFIRTSDELKGILNSGHSRPNAYVIRTVGENHEPKSFSTWGAKAIALIGKLPATLHDRSIVVELRRKQSGEGTEKLRYVSSELFSILRSKLLRVAQDMAEILQHSRPQLPGNISDRAADNWEPLLAIAELAGHEWTCRAIQAAENLSSRDQDAFSFGTELLKDIQEIFIKRQDDKISTVVLIEELCKDEERPWTTYNNNKHITPRQLAKMLKGYGIQSKSVRLGYDNTPKGFERNQFEDAWSRYLPASLSNATTPQSNQPANLCVADTKPLLQPPNPTATANTNHIAICGVVADRDDLVEVEV